MSYGLVTHVAINVPDLVEAETFYTEFLTPKSRFVKLLLM